MAEAGTGEPSASASKMLVSSFSGDFFSKGRIFFSGLFDSEFCRTVSGVIGTLIFWLNSPSLLVELLERSPAPLLRADKGERLSLLVSWLKEWGEKRRCLKEDAVEAARASVVGVNGEGTSGVGCSAVIGLDLLTSANPNILKFTQLIVFHQDQAF